MALDVEYIKVCIWKVFRFFVATSCTCVRNYPVISCILLFNFFIYMFFPSAFISVIYSLPIIIIMSLVFRFIVYGNQQNQKNAKCERNFQVFSKNHISLDDDLMVDEKQNNSSQPQSVRRRNAKENDKWCDGVQVEVEKDMVYSTIYDDPLVDNGALMEENPKEIREVEMDRVSAWQNNPSTVSQWSVSNCGDHAKEKTAAFIDVTGRKSEANITKDAEDKEEEEARRDDKRNLMDLGISEIETNKRLESLIARRKARKLLSMQVRKTLMNMGRNDAVGQINSILIPRHNHFPNCGLGSPQVSPTPGSAPSILLPNHNPFDIPYDPYEEKPNLTGGSFHQEFLEGPLKDIIFCRHESFSLGAFTPAAQEEQKGSRRENLHHPNFSIRRALETPEYSRFRNLAGDEGSRKSISTETCEEDKFNHDTNTSHYNDIPQYESAEQVINEVDNIHNEENTTESLAKMNCLDMDDASKLQTEFNLVDNIHQEDKTSELHTQESSVENIYHEEDVSEAHTEIDNVKDATDESSSSSSSEVNAPFTVANRDIILKSLSFSIRKNMASDNEAMSTRNGLSYLETPLYCEKKMHEEYTFCPIKGFKHAPSFSIASDLQVEVSEPSSPGSIGDETISVSDTQSVMVIEEDESGTRPEQEVREDCSIEAPYSSSNLSKYEDPISPVMLPNKVVQEVQIVSCVSPTETELHMDRKIEVEDYNHSYHEGVERCGILYSLEESPIQNMDSPTAKHAPTLIQD